MPNKEVQYIHLGLVDYKEAWDFQTKLFDAIVAQKLENRNLSVPVETPNYLILCEHPHVYTLGRNGKMEHLLLEESGLKNAEASFYEINRGGDITYHGPGQLVGYPVMDLENFFTDIHRYMRFMEETVIRTLADVGVISGRIEGLTGVWIDHEDAFKARKICAMGVKTSRWVTMHGFALNLNVDLSYFKNIIPCGISDKAVASLHLEKSGIPMAEIEQLILKNFAEVFDCSIKEKVAEL